jgi:signal peptidase I
VGLDFTEANDLEPGSFGAHGDFTLRHVRLFRDTYYTQGPGDGGEVQTYHVQPGHYFCMGDNSPHSLDSRSWGLVPRRLMLGKAVLIYFPFTRVGRIR